VISQNTIQQILSRIDVLDVVGGFVKLKKRGANYLGLCPFHNERTPSFTVSPSKEIFKCFGCGKSGNSISFLMELEKFSYAEALKWLAKRYNIEVEETGVSPEAVQQQQVAESLYIINQFAQKFYEKQLFETEDGVSIGLSYIQQRGFTEATMRKFGLGYAPDKRDTFTKEALANHYNKDLLLKTGLVANRHDQLVDNYRDRIIFPIHNNSGKIIGFGARLIKSNDKAPKYINTPENELYIKSKILYGNYFARQAIDKHDECLLVEGYTDVLSLHQAGIENVVASGGTSLTQDQLRLIKKYTKNLTIVYDGDAAGVKAALRGLDMALEEGLNVKLVLVPDKEDPDSYLQKVGASAFKSFVQENKKDFVLFKLELSLKDVGTDAAKKSELVNQIAETIAKIDKAEDFSKQQEYIRQSAQLLKVEESGFTALVNKFIRNRIAVQEQKLPFDEAKHHEEQANEGTVVNFDDQTFELLYKDEMQEKEIVRVLLEHGQKPWDAEQNIAGYILSELPEEEMFQSGIVLKFLQTYKNLFHQLHEVDKNLFVYSEDKELSIFTVSLLSFPHEQSKHWKEESNSGGFQKSLYEQDYKSFMHSIGKDGKERLSSFLLTQKDTTNEEVISAVNYLKLRKIKKLLMQNQVDMQTADASQFNNLILTHQYLKQQEIEITKKLGTVILR
jgi:DNA primase